MDWLPSIILCLPVVLIVLAIYRAITFNAGNVGERIVMRRLRWLPKKEYFIINDLLLDKGGGYTTQIDHVVVSQYGIFVIETKNISGYIYGNENSQKWKRDWRGWYRGIERRNVLEFDNPILQNEAHIKVLKNKLGNSAAKFISIIVFCSNATLKVSEQTAYVIYPGQLRKIIRWYKEPIMTEEEASKIYNDLVSFNITDKNARKEHSIKVQENKYHYEQKRIEAEANGICPQCGGNLVLRNGKYGTFYGCSNYPNCKYTKPTN